MNLVKKFTAFLVIFIALSFVSAQTKKTASAIQKEALGKESIFDSIEYLKKNISEAASPSDTRSLLYFTGQLQEQLGLYTDASASYAKAAGIAAQDATGMPKVTSEQLVLCAVRASLCAGNWETASSYLDSEVRNSKNENIIALTKLYSVWSELCRASSDDGQGISDSVELLKAYSTMQSMKSVRPQVLLTLFHLTEDSSYADTLKKEYPESPEYAVASGQAELARAPFWYFVPKLSSEKKETPSAKSNTSTEETVKSEVTVTETKNTSTEENEAPPLTEKKPGKKQQLGLFRDKANADDCIRNAKSKGFSAYSYTETRSSGTTYIIVVVDENAEGTIGKQLKEAGIDCYAID